MQKRLEYQLEFHKQKNGDKPKRVSTLVCSIIVSKESWIIKTNRIKQFVKVNFLQSFNIATDKRRLTFTFFLLSFGTKRRYFPRR